MTYERDTNALLAVESARYKVLEAFVTGVASHKPDTSGISIAGRAAAALFEAEEAGKAAYFKGVMG